MEKLGEYDAETPLSHRYCQQVSEVEYEDEMLSTTHDALKNLMAYVEKTPEVYKRIIAKRRLEEEENAGYLSFLKARLMVAIQGDNYGVSSISDGECLKEVNKFQNDICDVFNYSQDSRSRGTRFSKRLEAKQRRQRKDEKKENVADSHRFPDPPVLTPVVGDPSSNESDLAADDLTPLARRPLRSSPKKQKVGAAGEPASKSAAPPPPPPPPPLPLTPQTSTAQRSSTPHPLPPKGVDAATLMSPPAAPPPLSKVLKDSTNKRLKKTPAKTPNGRPTMILAASEGRMLKNKPRTEMRHHGSTASLTSIGSIQDELLSFNKKAQLRSTCSVKSPGGTPLPTPRTKRLMSTPTTGSPTINNMFNTRMLDKFKNIRTPPSIHDSPASPFNSTVDFTDTP